MTGLANGPSQPQPRKSYEAEAIQALSDLVGTTPTVPTSGMGLGNRIAPAAWGLPPRQAFQFGDLRYVTDHCWVVVEFESAGGVTNLVKYWPMLDGELDERRFVLIHVMRIGSEQDYVAHRTLWHDLAHRMLSTSTRAHPWEAHLVTYGHPSADGLERAADLIRAALSECG